VTSTPPATHRPRLAVLDGLRLVAAVSVMLFHYTAADKLLWGVHSRFEFPTLNVVSRYGYLGVELFFIISGFVILMTAYGRTIEDFVASRFSRLFPAYWVAVIGTFTLQSFWHGDRSSTSLDALVNLTMLQEAFNVTNVQGAFWTLWYELKFYLLIGLFIVIGMTRRRLIAFAFLWPIVGQIAAATHTTFLSSVLMPSFAPYFAAGMLMYIAHRHGHNLLTWLGIAMNYVLCARQAINYSIDRTPHITGSTYNQTAVALIIAAMFALVILCSNGAISRIEWRWLTWFGLLTYPLYLVHGQIGFFVIDVVHADLNGWLVLALACATSFVLAWLIHLVAEKPFQGRMRRAIRQSLTETVSLREPERVGT
jgi:peptidoglycan/LPS O-acetylase OafA/YrhL